MSDLKRLLHKLFRRHRWERFELRELIKQCAGEGQCHCEFNVWYVGYRCSCGEQGYEVPA